MTDIFKAIADPTRRKILLMIAEQPSNINLIKESFDMSRPAISKHIKILQDSKLISIKSDHKDGRQRNCYPQLEALQELNNYIEALESFWDKKMTGLNEYLNKNQEL